MLTLKEAFKAKYPECSKVLKHFEDANGCECTWENLTKVRLQTFVSYLSERMSPNSVKAYCSKLKTVMTSYNEEVSLPRDYEKVLLVRKDASQHIYLNKEEIQRIISFEPRSESEHIIKNQFLIGCLTGARHSDYTRFTRSNIVGKSLVYVSMKTHIQASIPLSPVVAKIIEENELKGYNAVTYSDVYFNRLIKKICRAVGINENVSIYCFGKFTEGEKWKYVTSHTARRSFATNLYISGVDIYTISALCGHSSVEMTKEYICCPPIVGDKVMQYLDGYEDI